MKTIRQHNDGFGGHGLRPMMDIKRWYKSRYFGLLETVGPIVDTIRFPLRDIYDELKEGFEGQNESS